MKWVARASGASSAPLEAPWAIRRPQSAPHTLPWDAWFAGMVGGPGLCCGSGVRWQSESHFHSTRRRRVVGLGATCRRAAEVAVPHRQRSHRPPQRPPLRSHAHANRWFHLESWSRGGPHDRACGTAWPRMPRATYGTSHRAVPRPSHGPLTPQGHAVVHPRRPATWRRRRQRGRQRSVPEETPGAPLRTCGRGVRPPGARFGFDGHRGVPGGHATSVRQGN